jgi:hypothetical protein
MKLPCFFFFITACGGALTGHDLWAMGWRNTNRWIWHAPKWLSFRSW